MKGLLFTISVLISALIADVAAETPKTTKAPSKNYYLNIGMGAVFSNTNTSFTSNSNTVLYSPTSIGTSLFSLPNINWRNNFKNGYDFNLSLGYYFKKNLHGDLEFLYQNLQRESYGTYGWLEQNSLTGAVYAQQANNPISTIASRASIYSLFTNTTYDFNKNQKWTPFLGAGIGIAWLSSGSVQTNNILNINDPSTPLIETAPAIQNSPSLSGSTFAWQLKAGFRYVINDSASAAILYRLFKATNFKGSESSIITNPGRNGQTVFYAGQHQIKGLLTNAIELNCRLNL
ncbi:TPA: outer membrane beta-barrel protein [Legionella pneumophila]|uniref:outer membrane beta-barrel protein n=1 Tax=Legionella pneumophila TaxID=446 RepID=UPI0009B49B16|nr:outer membrane beta-barrel protein [Legionella pneumophila]